VGADFDPAAGFVRRRGVRQHYATVGAHVSGSRFRIQETNPYLEADVLTNRAGVVESRSLGAGLATEFLDGGSLDLRVHHRFEHLEEVFRIPAARGEVVLPGDYSFPEAEVAYASSRARPFSAHLSLGAGGYYDGSRRSVQTGAVWQPGFRWLVDLSAEHNQVRVPAIDQDGVSAGMARFSADVMALRLGYAHSRRLFGRAAVQYNGATNQLVTNVRLNLVHAPLSDLFLVFAERRDLDSGSVMERGFTAKVTRLLSF